MSQIPVTIKDAQNLLHEELRGLPDTGTNGFEGFVAEALTELTGQAFYVAKSGHQGGSDVRSDPCNFFKLGVEGKNYGSTKLPLDALKNKITDASTEKTPVDLWILAATGPMDISNREKLDAHGEACGIGVIVLDWPRNLTHVCDLTAICVAAKQTCHKFLNAQEPITRALKLIREAPEFESVQNRVLQRLTQADAGYESTRHVIESWMAKAQSTLANARSRLGGHHNLAEGKDGIICRGAINARLDDWFAGDWGVAGLLGDEGMGKSWAALDWYNRLISSDAGAPLTIFLAAKQIDGSDIKSTLAKALYVQTGIRSVAFWEKRLTLWERHGGDGVRILILLDGLNENFQFTKWADWLQPLFDDDLDGMYRVIVSCWPNWWYESLFELANLVPPPLEITVEGFNDAELDALLQAMKIERSDLANAVLPLMRVPRLSSLVAKHRDELTDSGDVTAERVIYEDWKDRLKRRGAETGLTHEAMQSFAAQLGEKLKLDVGKTTITRKEVIDSLSKDSGKSGIELIPPITELSSGAWLKPGDKPHTFRVAADRIPFVLAVTLMSHIEQETEATAIDARIAEFLDPLKAHSLGAAILRGTLTVALLKPDASLALRQTLLHRWLEQENFQVSDFEALWRLVGLDSSLFLDLAETRWLASDGRYFHDEVMIKAFANAADFVEFQSTLNDYLKRWLGTAWPDPKVGAVLGSVDQTKEDSRQRAAETHSRYADWISSETAKSFMPIQIDTTNRHWSWLCARALAILSYTKRAPLAPALEAWALSRAIMNWAWAQHEDTVAWILRLNLEDASETATAVRRIITRFKEQRNPICEQAAGYLTAAMSHVERADSALSFETDPKKDPPAPLEIPGMDATTLFENTKQYLSPLGWKTYDPQSGQSLINALIERGLDENEGALALLIDNLPDLLILLTPNNRNHLKEAIRKERNAIKDVDEAAKRATARFEKAELIMQLYDAKPAEQSTLVLSNGFQAGQKDSWLPIYRPIALHDITRTDLETTLAIHLASWLDYVCSRLPKHKIAELDFLPHLVVHEDQGVRDGALVLAAHGRHMPALQAFVASPYSTPPSGEAKPDREREYWRNRALLEYCGFSPDASMLRRLSPESAALVTEQRMTDPGVLERFNDYLQGEFEALMTETSWSSARYWCSYREAIEALVKHDAAAVLKWLTPWAEKLKGVHVPWALMSPFPVIDTMRALSIRVPEVSLRLYEDLTDPASKSIFSIGGIILFPFEMPSSKPVENLCNGLLTNAKTDRALLEIVCASHRHNRLDWLFGWIEHLESSRTPADVAKAYTLLGLCDRSDCADELWGKFLARPPLDPWLKRVLKESLQDYRRNCQARDTLENFCASDIPTARHALRHLEEICDMRTGIWFCDLIPELHNLPYEHELTLSLSEAALNQASNLNRDRRRDKLYHTPLAFSIMAPWK